MKLVNAGIIPITPCVFCGSTDPPTRHPIHDTPDCPVRRCRSCHAQRRKPIHTKVKIAGNHLTLLPPATADALARVKGVIHV
jgi:hypothetical protein